VARGRDRAQPSDRANESVHTEKGTKSACKGRRPTLTIDRAEAGRGPRHVLATRTPHGGVPSQHGDTAYNRRDYLLTVSPR